MLGDFGDLVVATQTFFDVHTYVRKIVPIWRSHIFFKRIWNHQIGRDLMLVEMIYLGKCFQIFVEYSPLIREMIFFNLGCSPPHVWSLKLPSFVKKTVMILDWSRSFKKPCETMASEVVDCPSLDRHWMSTSIYIYIYLYIYIFLATNTLIDYTKIDRTEGSHHRNWYNNIEHHFARSNFDPIFRSAGRLTALRILSGTCGLWSLDTSGMSWVEELIP